MRTSSSNRAGSAERQEALIETLTAINREIARVTQRDRDGSAVVVATVVRATALGQRIVGERRPSSPPTVVVPIGPHARVTRGEPGQDR